MSGRTGDGPSLADSEVLLRINGQLEELLPEVQQLRRSRWLARGLAVLMVLVVTLGALGVKAYRDDRAEDCRDRARARAELREYNSILIGVASGPNPDAETRAVLAELETALDEALPPLDC